MEKYFRGIKDFLYYEATVSCILVQIKMIDKKQDLSWLLDAPAKCRFLIRNEFPYLIFKIAELYRISI